MVWFGSLLSVSSPLYIINNQLPWAVHYLLSGYNVVYGSISRTSIVAEALSTTLYEALHNTGYDGDCIIPYTVPTVNNLLESLK